MSYQWGFHEPERLYNTFNEDNVQHNGYYETVRVSLAGSQDITNTASAGVNPSSITQWYPGNQTHTLCPGTLQIHLVADDNIMALSAGSHAAIKPIINALAQLMTGIESITSWTTLLLKSSSRSKYLTQIQ